MNEKNNAGRALLYYLCAAAFGLGAIYSLVVKPGMLRFMLCFILCGVFVFLGIGAAKQGAKDVAQKGQDDIDTPEKPAEEPAPARLGSKAWEESWAQIKAAREARQKEQEAQAAQLLDSLEKAEIKTDGIKGTVKDQAEIMDIRYNTINVKTQAFNVEDYVVVDLETTGTRKRDAIVSVAAIVFEGFEPVRSFYSLVDPERHIPEQASAVNGLKDEDVQGAPTIWQILPSLQAFVGSLPIVGHNLPFDLGYLYRYGFELGNNKRYDTLRLARRALDLDRYTLADCCQECGVPVVDAHNALYDCLMTGRLFAALTDRLINK